MNTQDQEILLESGTNELEVVEFTVSGNRFGINVIKVREIIPPAPVTKIPLSHPNVEGILSLRGEVLSVINLAKALRLPEKLSSDEEKFIIAEFNKMKVAFRVEAVTQIHRLSWQAIRQPDDIVQGMEHLITGVIRFDDENTILLLDFEKILFDIQPKTGIVKERLTSLGRRERTSKKLLIAEDSALLRDMLKETLEEAGYIDLEFCSDGQEAIEKLEAYAEEGDVTDAIQLVITDIEMPQMDGHHLTKRIKEDSRFQTLPVIIFSSLITDDLRHKGEQVGANAQVSKPDILNLVQTIDRHIL